MLKKKRRELSLFTAMTDMELNHYFLLHFSARGVEPIGPCTTPLPKKMEVHLGGGCTVSS